MARVSVEAERREQILSAACESIASLGYRAVRVADVARLAGVSSGTVHYYFDSKEVLLREAFRFNFENSVNRRSWMVDGDDAPVERLRRMLHSYLPGDPDTVMAWRVWVEFWAAALGSEDLQQLNDTVYENWREYVRESVEHAHAQGALDPSLSSGDITEMLVGMLDGLAIQALVGSGHMTRERMLEVCDRFVDTVLMRR